MTKVQDEAMTRLDSAVSEVFETMLERSCDPLEGEVDTVEGRIVARIQFTGAVDGECGAFRGMRGTRGAPLGARLDVGGAGVA